MGMNERGAGRWVMAGMLLLSLVGAARGEGFVLVTGDEYRHHLAERGAAPGGAPEPGTLRSSRESPENPTIVVRAPKRLKGLVQPIDIELAFTAGPDAQIDIESFRVYYGWLGIDITDRLKAHSTITPDGILARGAKLPEGEHELTLEIGDTRGRVGSRVVAFSVVAP